MSGKKLGSLAAALFLMGLLHTYWYRHYQPDDAFIYLVYVKSYFNGLGLTFNGELVEGFSSVLWTVLITFFSWSGLDPLFASKGLGWISYFSLAFMLFKAQRVTRGSSYGALFTLALYFSVPLLAMWAAGAMETILFSALIALAAGLYFYARLIGGGNLLFALSGFAFALVSLTRPEGFALIGAVFAFELILVLHGRKVNWRGTIFTIGVYFVPTALMFVGRMLIYGKWFPATVGAKTGSLSVQMHHGLSYLLGFSQEYLLLVCAYVLALVYVVLVVKKRNIEQYFLVWMLAILVVGYLSFSWLVGGDWMIGWRFVTPVVPFLVLTIGIALSELKLIFSVPVFLAVVFSFVWQTFELHDISIRQANSDKGDILMGQYIHDLNLASGSKIAVIDAGAIPYYAELPAIDMIGLNDSYLSSLPGGFLQKYDNKYVLESKPSVIQFHTRFISAQGDVAPTEAFVGATMLFYSEEFQRWYKRDVNSPVPHLFRRREVPLDKTFMSTFFDARITGDYQGESLRLNLKKKGDGIWVAPSGSHIESGAVYVRVRLSSNHGQVLDEKMLPIPKNMLQGDAVDFNLKMARTDQRSYKISACPVLAGVREMKPCLDGEGYEHVVSDESAALALGTYRFDDERLVLNGWSGLEDAHVWSLGQESIIKFYVDDVSVISRLSLQLMPFGDQRLKVELNGVELYQGKLSAAGQVVLPVASHLKRENVLRLSHPDAKQPSENDRRFVAFALQGLIFE